MNGKKFFDTADAFVTRNIQLVKYAVWVIATLAFGSVCAWIPNPAQTAESVTFVTSLALLYFAVNDDVKTLPQMLFITGSVAALMIVRAALFYHISADYALYLQPWAQEMASYPGTGGLAAKIGNYNMPYMYIIFGIVKSGINDLVGYKTVSVAFDLVFAFYAMKLVSLKTERINMRLAAFVLALAIPTVILNGAFWAQCDSIYTAFCAGALYYALKGKSKASWVMFGLAFAFKLQAVFFAPVMLYMCFIRKVKLADAWTFAATFAAALLPAVFAGRSLPDCLSVYIDQVNLNNGRINLNAANVWNFLPDHISFDNFNKAGLYVAGAAALGLLYFLWTTRERGGEGDAGVYKNAVNAAFALAAVLPFFLPKMHERYFFMADCLSLFVFLFNKKRWYIPMMVIFSSYASYWHFLFGMEIIEYKYAAALMFFAILLVIKDLVYDLLYDGQGVTGEKEPGRRTVMGKRANAPRTPARIGSRRKK